MGFGIKFNSSYFVKAHRIAQLPKITKLVADAATKRDAEGVIQEYKDGLNNNDFGLKPLIPFSADQKKESGYEGGPLVGAGESEENSLINAWEIVKLKNGYQIKLKEEKHHNSDLPLNILFQIHEKGIRIKVTEEMRGYLAFKGLHLKQETKYITIPPRNTQQLSIDRWLSKRDKASIFAKAKEVIRIFLKTGTVKGVIEFK
jgi:hypothetical protein